MHTRCLTVTGKASRITAANPFGDEDDDEDDEDEDDDDDLADVGATPTSADSYDGESLFRDLAWKVTDPAAMEQRVVGEVSALEAVRVEAG